MTTKEAYLRLQPALQEVFDLEAENVVKLHSVVAEDASPVKSPLYILELPEQDSPDEPPEERVALKEPAWVLLLQGEQLTSGGPDQGQAVLHAPHLERNNEYRQDASSHARLMKRCQLTSTSRGTKFSDRNVASVRDHSQSYVSGHS